MTTLLSHSTTDLNQERAFRTLRERFPTWDEVRRAPTAEVEDAVRVAGLANQKAPRIQEVLDRIADDPRGADLEWLGRIPLDEAMAFLTSLTGVGPKTAACVMCFCFDAHIVPADTHVHRIALRTGIVPARRDGRRRAGAPDALDAAGDGVRHPHAPDRPRSHRVRGPRAALRRVRAPRRLPDRHRDRPAGGPEDLSQSHSDQT